MKLLLLLTPLFLLLGSAATAQEIPTNNEELLEYLFGDEEEGDDIFRESMREKIRISESQLVRILAARDAAESKEDPMTESGRSSSAAFNETAVSGGTDIEAELHAAINPTDSSNIVVGVIDMFSKTQGFGAPATTGIYYSRDFGRTWQKSRTILISEGYSSVIGGGDPMFAFDADGTLYYSWIDLALQGQGSLKNAMSWAVSKNGGETWELGEGTIGDGLLGGRNREMFDKQWMIVDRTNSPYRGTLYTGLLHITSSTGGSGRVGLRHKAPDSDRFTTETVLPAGPAFAYNQLASTAIGPDGKLHLMFFGSSATDPGQMALWLTGSSDGGKSLVAPQKITNIEVPVRSAGQEQGTLIGFDQQRIQPSSHIAADAFSTGPHAGNLYAVWAANGVDQKEATGMDIYFTRSTDGGATWQDPWIVNDDGDPETGGREAVDQFHPSIAVNDRGIVTLTWYDRRNDPGNRMTDYYAAHSFDGGVSFTNSYPISSAPSDFSRIGGAL